MHKNKSMKFRNSCICLNVSSKLRIKGLKILPTASLTLCKVSRKSNEHLSKSPCNVNRNKRWYPQCSLEYHIQWFSDIPADTSLVRNRRSLWISLKTYSSR